MGQPGVGLQLVLDVPADQGSGGEECLPGLLFGVVQPARDLVHISILGEFPSNLNVESLEEEGSSNLNCEVRRRTCTHRRRSGPGWPSHCGSATGTAPWLRP